MGAFMRRVLKIILSLVILLIVVAIAVPFFVPADKIKDEVLAQIEAKTGREVSIDHVKFAIFPTIALDAETVKIGNPAWALGGNMAEIKTLKVGLELLPLLHGEVKLKELTLDQPVILLIQQKGRANWNFAKAETQKTEEASKPQAGSKQATNKTMAMLNDLHLAQITIKDGVINFRDEIAGKTENITGINLSLVAPNLSEKAELEFSAVYGGKDVKINLTLDKPFAFEIGSLTDVTLKAGYGALDFSWVGKASLKPDGRPILTGKVTIPSLDVAALSQKDESKDTTPSKAAAPAKEGASHWSDAPIKLDALGQADADLTISIGSLKMPQTTLDNINTDIHLAQGNLSMKIGPVNAYGGTVKLSVGASAAGAVNVALLAEHAQAEPLLHDFAGYDRVSGTIDIETKLSTYGNSQRTFVGALSGTGSFHFKDGKLKGVDLAGLLHNLTGAQDTNAGTAFSELSGTYTVAKGIISNNDLKMSSPLLRVTGAGTADLPNWQENFLLKPSLVASLQGQGGKDAPGITIPVKVEGPLDHPHYQPDLQGLLQDNLKDPAKLKDTVKGLKDTLKQNGGLKGLLR